MVKPVLELNKRLMIALDVPTGQEALTLAEQLRPLGVSYKVGMQLFYAEGMAVVRELQTLGSPVFVDLKLHDIPATVAKASESLVGQGVSFFNLHTQGGPEMMQAAVEAARRTALARSVPPPLVIGVTLLTSLSESLLHSHLWVDASPKHYVTHQARAAQQAGLDGVVCSAQEASDLRKACGEDFLLITPGIRPKWSEANDQQRIVTPQEAIRRGSDYLVVGRPVTGAENPLQAAERVLEEMAAAVEGSRV